MSNKDDFKEWAKDIISRIVGENYEIIEDDESHLIIVRSEAEAKEVSQILFAPALIQEQPRSEVTIFFKPCPMHFPLSTIKLLAIEHNRVGLVDMEHNQMFTSDGATGIGTSNAVAWAKYSSLVDITLEDDWIMAYHGSKNEG